MDLSIYFEPLESFDKDVDEVENRQFKHLFGRNDGSHFPDLEDVDLAIIGIKESRRSRNIGCAEGPDHIREYLYDLYEGDFKSRIVDLGNIRAGNTVEDTYFAVGDVVEQLAKQQIIPIIIGGSQDLTYANYLAYERLEQTVNLVCIDDRINFSKDIEGDLTDESFLGKIVLHQPNYLFNLSNLGIQTYLIDPEIREMMDKLYFDTYRLGWARTNIRECEPIIRNADILSFDLSAIKMSDAPGHKFVGPNGFYSEEACQLMRYAGMSDKLSSLGLYGFNPKLDEKDKSASLIAQMIWCFIEGFYSRKGDYPIGSKKDYTKFRVSLMEDKYEILFYKSPKSDRWWMEVPFPPSQRSRYARHQLIPCSYEDYQEALKGEMPDKWILNYNKLS